MSPVGLDGGGIYIPPLSAHSTKCKDLGFQPLLPTCSPEASQAAKQRRRRVDTKYKAEETSESRLFLTERLKSALGKITDNDDDDDEEQ